MEGKIFYPANRLADEGQRALLDAAYDVVNNYDRTMWELSHLENDSLTGLPARLLSPAKQAFISEKSLFAFLVGTTTVDAYHPSAGVTVIRFSDHRRNQRRDETLKNLYSAQAALGRVLKGVVHDTFGGVSLHAAMSVGSYGVAALLSNVSAHGVESVSIARLYSAAARIASRYEIKREGKTTSVIFTH